MAVLVAAAVLMGAQPGFAAGFALYEAGARSSALGGAMVGRADDLSAIFWNPAGITQLPGLRAMIGATAIMPRTDIDTRFGPVTTRTGMKEDVFFPPHVYLSYDIGGSVWLGLGVFSPFGLGVEYAPDWPGRINNIKTTIDTLNINPNIAFKVTDYLSLAVGLDAMHLGYETRRTLPLFPLGLQDTTLKADSFGYGFNAGVHVKPTDYLSAGISYRSQVRQKLKGDATFAPAGFLSAPIQGSIILPDMIFAGVMVRPIKPLTVEVGLVWTHWSLIRQLDISFNNPLGTLSELKQWHDTWRAQLGVEYRAADWLDLRAGYVFDEEAIPGTYADYVVPASDRHQFSLGAGFHWRNWTLDLSYSYLFMVDKEINNSRAIGVLPSEFKNRQVNLVGVSLGFKY